MGHVLRPQLKLPFFTTLTHGGTTESTQEKSMALYIRFFRIKTLFFMNFRVKVIYLEPATVAHSKYITFTI